MADKFNIDFKKYSGMDIISAHRVLMKKGITTNDIESVAMKLSRNITEDVGNKDLDDDYKILLHLLLVYYMFGSGIRSYDDWMKEVAAEHDMKPEKYIKIMFDL